MERTGRVTSFTTLPAVASRQWIGFAVSPDGAHLEASILTTPEPDPTSTDRQAMFKPGSHWVSGVRGPRPQAGVG